MKYRGVIDTNVLYAVRAEDYIATRAARSGKGAFARILKRVPRRAPLPGDER
ncbi:MAG: hypothetical protein LBW77_01565 [Verrucomicrobiota bacterium]|jgi:hypothetical protein|nr:hypothetical protein [Verrucomicrobiota bacterium]